MKVTVGVIGTGNMGSAFVRGWLRCPEADVDLVIHDVIADRTASLAGEPGVTLATSVEDLARRSDIILVVVKPKDAPIVLREVAMGADKDKTVLSTAAGVTLTGLRGALGPGPALLRIMPNLGVELGEGVLALCPEPGTADDVIVGLKRLFACMGLVEVVDESLLDAVTAVSGSSIAFLALALEGVEDGAVKVGMPRATARSFARQTAVAAALLLKRSSGPAAELKDQVASPGGTTITGLAVLEDSGVRGAFVRAIEQATERSRQLRDGG